MMSTINMIPEDKNEVRGTLNRVLSIGMDFYHPAVTNTKYGSDISLLEYGIILWDPNSTITEYRGIAYSRDPLNSSILFTDIEDSFWEDVRRGKMEMSKILELGRSIIIFTPEPQRIGNKGINHLTEILPVDNLATTKGSGQDIEFCGKEPFNKFWKANKNCFAYRAYIKECKNGEPIFFIKNTKEILGIHFHRGNGNVIFIPSFLDGIINNISKKKKDQLINNFIDSIIDLVSELNKVTNDFEPPNWCSNYLLPEEDLNREKLARLEAGLKEIQLKITQQKDLQAKLEKHKVLFAGDGRALELEVGNIFRKLGFSVEEGPFGRDDLIINYRNKIAVVEVKGVSKSAAESHATQLEKWVSEYTLQNGIKPKGLLIINAYKNIPLKNRKEKSFPDQMVPYSEKRDHCLLTGLQLLGLYLDIMKNILKKEELIDHLFNTNGIFKEYEDWSKFLEMSK